MVHWGGFETRKRSYCTCLWRRTCKGVRVLSRGLPARLPLFLFFFGASAPEGTGSSTGPGTTGPLFLCFFFGPSAPVATGSSIGPGTTGPLTDPGTTDPSTDLGTTAPSTDRKNDGAAARLASQNSKIACGGFFPVEELDLFSSSRGRFWAPLRILLCIVAA